VTPTLVFTILLYQPPVLLIANCFYLFFPSFGKLLVQILIKPSISIGMVLYHCPGGSLFSSNENNNEPFDHHPTQKQLTNKLKYSTDAVRINTFETVWKTKLHYTNETITASYLTATSLTAI